MKSSYGRHPGYATGAQGAWSIRIRGESDNSGLLASEEGLAQYIHGTMARRVEGNEQTMAI